MGRGGAREGTGPKPKYGEATKPVRVAISVPKPVIDEISRKSSVLTALGLDVSCFSAIDIIESYKKLTEG